MQQKDLTKDLQLGVCSARTHQGQLLYLYKGALGSEVSCLPGWELAALGAQGKNATSGQGAQMGHGSLTLAGCETGQAQKTTVFFVLF